MDWIDKLVFAHVAHSPSVIAAGAVVLSNLDRGIKFALQYFSASQIDGAIDEAAAMAKGRVDKDAAK
jgi:hypothetical protein